jgi:Rad52/22 family double-strand break repair protein
MKTWDDDIARKLREPLPREQIGKLPKVPKSKQNDDKRACRYCGGWHQPIPDASHVDYVSHTTTTDRLNTIVGQDGWSYTIDRIQEDGAGHVRGILATLTIAGVSKQEAGSPGKAATDWGEELKLAISDWLPRAAMRFGLGLEVWAKQPLDRLILDDAHDGQPTRQAGGRAPEASPSPAPEGGVKVPTPPSGSNGPDLGRITSVAIARALVKGQTDEWRAAFQRFATEARDSGEAEKWSELEGYRKLIERTHAALTTGEAA